MKFSTNTQKLSLVLFAATLALSACSPATEESAPADSAETTVPGKASLSVELAVIEERTIPLKMSVNGSLAAWQEAVIGSQLNGVRIDSLRAEVGDTVKKGQTLAVFDQQTVQLFHGFISKVNLLPSPTV